MVGLLVGAMCTYVCVDARVWVRMYAPQEEKRKEEGVIWDEFSLDRWNPKSSLFGPILKDLYGMLPIWCVKSSS